MKILLDYDRPSHGRQLHSKPLSGVNECYGDFATVIPFPMAYWLAMSKLKSPQDKKHTSLARDRRNDYGECPTSSRKNIRRGKQRSHMQLRRAANEELRPLRGETPELDPDLAEGRAKDRILALSRSSFKKKPDTPLGIVLGKKRKLREKTAKPQKS
jgi:hypothetical protein